MRSMVVKRQSALAHIPIHSLDHADSAQVPIGCMEMEPPLLSQGVDQKANITASYKEHLSSL